MEKICLINLLNNSNCICATETKRQRTVQKAKVRNMHNHDHDNHFLKYIFIVIHENEHTLYSLIKEIWFQRQTVTCVKNRFKSI